MAKKNWTWSFAAGRGPGRLCVKPRHGVAAAKRREPEHDDEDDDGEKEQLDEIV